jgi:hypothetical protein
MPPRSAKPFGRGAERGAARTGTHAPRAGGARQARASRVAALLLTLLSAIGVAAEGDPAAAPDGRPSVYLAGANIPRAKALALDAALVKGWRVAESEPDHVVFETLLDTPASTGPPGVAIGDPVPPRQTLLRIRAEFSTTDNGVITALRADEVWYAGTARQWITEVTAEYRGNLMNALSSLRAQWAAIAPVGTSPRLSTSAPVPQRRPARVTAPAAAPDPSAPADVRSPPYASGTARPAPGGERAAALPPAGPSPAQKPVPDDPVGVWAYHAEELAAARGCVLSDRGAVLVGETEGSELHEVHCQGSERMLVRCDRVSCVSGR